MNSISGYQFIRLSKFSRIFYLILAPMLVLWYIQPDERGEEIESTDTGDFPIRKKTQPVEGDFQE